MQGTAMNFSSSGSDNDQKPTAAEPTPESFPQAMYSKKTIVTAGKVLRENLTEDAIPVIEASRGMAVLDAFKIAHQWRDAHMLPLMKVRKELTRQVHTIEKAAITAARLKRMDSIRRKLRRPFTLYQIQDIAGCRAILRSMKEVDRLVKFYRDGGSRHSIQSEDNYILEPKIDGYRSHHLILKFNGTEEYEAFNRRSVEIQIRTRLQHAWATAVESVGLIRQENIKGGEGDNDWRRFFELMSSEIAYQENQAPPASASLPREEIHREVRSISKKIKAVSTLKTFSRAINFTEKYSKTYAKYFILQFDYDTRSVYVEPFYEYKTGSEKYIEQEKNNKRRNTVFVEVSKVNDLKKAFPNYFLDVSAFSNNLKNVLSPGYKKANPYDLSWLANYR